VRRSGPHGEVREILISVLGHSGPSLYGSGPGRVSIARLAEAPFTRAPRHSARHSEERSDQIEAAGVTCGPRRPKVPVMGSQAHAGHPAAASRPGTVSYKFITTLLPPSHRRDVNANG
jgi:hypothetical protein